MWQLLQMKFEWSGSRQIGTAINSKLWSLVMEIDLFVCGIDIHFVYLFI